MRCVPSIHLRCLYLTFFPPLVCFLSPGLGFPHSLLLPHRLRPSGLPVPLSKGRTVLCCCCCCCLVSRTCFISNVYFSWRCYFSPFFILSLRLSIFQFSVFSSFYLIHADASALSRLPSILQLFLLFLPVASTFSAPPSSLCVCSVLTHTSPP